MNGGTGLGNGRLIGQRLGRYRIASSLGRGGMAEVFKASDDRLSREVAIKVVLPSYGSDPQLLQRFMREARVVASLEHPNILPIYDFGEHEGLPFLVLPLIRGGTLADRLDGRALDPSRVATWLRDLARALDAAHGAGVLHRDVKPGNVLVGRDEHLFLADFGIARLCDATRLTRTGTVVGTPVYMAPEVAAGQPAEAASDLYSLAVMSYEMLAGHPPFEGENMLSILHQHATSPVPPITGRLDGLGVGVDRVLEHGLAKQPAGRPPTCHAFTELLAEQLPGAGVESPRPVSDLVPTLVMTRESTTGPIAAPAVTSPTPGDAYTTVHAAPGTWLQLRQWGLAGLLGGAVALAGFLALRGIEREPVATADPVEASRPVAPQPAAEAAPTTGTVASVPEPVPPPPTVATAEPSAPRPAPAASSEAPAAAPERSTEPATGSERMRFNALRAFTSRSSEKNFRKAEEMARRLPDHGPAAGQRAAMEAYARGGLAYIGGDDASATAALHQALQDQRFVAFWGPSPLMLLASSAADHDGFESWELALGYGDPRKTAGGTLDTRLSRHPENARLHFARALVHRLDGEHEAVVRHAVPVFQKLGVDDAPEARSYLAQVIGDAHLALDRGAEAMEWFQRAFEAGGPFRGVVAMRGAEAAREMRRPDVMAEFLRRGCEADFQPACRRLQAHPRRAGDRRQ